MLLWVLDPPNVYLVHWELILTWHQVVQEGTQLSFPHSFPKLTLGQCPKPMKYPFWWQLLTTGAKKQVMVVAPYVRIPPYEKKIKQAMEMRTMLSQQRWGPALRVPTSLE